MGNAIGTVTDLRHPWQSEILMKNTLLLFLSTEHLHAQLMARGTIIAQWDFLNSSEGQENFAAFLPTVKCPTYLLVDLIEEDFRQESVPHLSGRRRTALLRRKFEQFYRGTPFHQATLLRRQKSGRRDDDMLFSALTNPSLLTPWLNILITQQTPLAGIYSVPQISAPLVKNHPSKHLLLISWEKSAGLRQTYFSDHRLQISRLTPIHDDVSFQEAVVTELSRTYQYLKSLSLLPPEQILDVRLLGHNQDLAELQTRFQTSTNIRYEYVDLADVAQQSKINHTFTDSDARQIFLHQLALKPPHANYANAHHLHHYHLWRLRRTLNWGTALLILVSLLWGSLTLWQSSFGTDERDSLKIQTQQIDAATREITATFPHTEVQASDIKAAVTTMRKLDQYGPVPNNILRPISRLFERYSKLELTQLDWHTSATMPIAPGTQPDVPAQVITLHGHLEEFAGNDRAALAYLDQFTQALTEQGYRVTILKKPLDISPSGNLPDRREHSETEADFSLELSWRPPV